MAAFKALLGENTVRNKDGSDASLDDLEKCDLVGLYFSAHWCPPCRGFTPVLAEFYKELKDAGKKFEIIFVSSDQDDAAFNSYYDEMPWLALKFSCEEQKQSLAAKYDISGIPTLILLKNDGSLASDDGRGMVTQKGPGSFPWGL